MDQADQRKTPLFTALLKHREKSRYSFHVPGHKNGESFPLGAQQLFQPLLSIDVTELNGLDDLFHPEGAIREAQDLLTAFYQSKKSYFLVNGSTIGNLAMILACCNQGDQVLVQRNSHKSVFNGLKLARVNPVFINPEIDLETGLATGISLEALRLSLELYPTARALILTYPNYYGMAPDYQSVINAAHEAGLIVLVDEAHGAHFTLGNPIPESTLSMGADIVVHSAHKMLPAMTMGSFIHINTDRIEISKIEDYLSMLQTSSPSYPIMASLDLARYSAAIDYSETQATHLKTIRKFKEQLKTIPQLRVIEGIDSPFYMALDPYKILIQVQCDLSGQALQKKLESEGVYIELADHYHLLFILPIIPTKVNLYGSVELMREILRNYPPMKKKPPLIKALGQKQETLSYSYIEQYDKKTERVSQKESINRIAGQDIIPYPPGIPLILTGEVLTPEKINILDNLRNQGVHFQGWDYADSIKVFVD